MNQSKRFTVCTLMNHKWVKTAIRRVPTERPHFLRPLSPLWQGEPRHRK